MEQILGIILHTIGGFSSASFYVPTYRIRQWAWETSWIVLGFTAWILMPLTGCLLLMDHVPDIFKAVTGTDLLWTYLFGALWGFGGLFSGMGLRFLGLSLGQSISLGVSSVVGTLAPPLLSGRLHALLSSFAGKILLAGLLLSIAGIFFCGLAGRCREKLTATSPDTHERGEFALTKGIIVAVLGGIMSACMAVAILFGEPIAQAALAAGASPVFRNLPIFVIAFAGGFSTNLVYVLVRAAQNKSLADFRRRPRALLVRNYGLAVASGIMWYLQFFFYGMGSTQMGAYEFASWSIHMTSIVLFSNLWGLGLKEWEHADRKTRSYLGAGIGLLMLSILVIGWGNYTSDR